MHDGSTHNIYKRVEGQDVALNKTIVLSVDVQQCQHARPGRMGGEVKLSCTTIMPAALLSVNNSSAKDYERVT